MTVSAFLCHGLHREILNDRGDRLSPAQPQQARFTTFAPAFDVCWHLVQHRQTLPECHRFSRSICVGMPQLDDTSAAGWKSILGRDRGSDSLPDML